MPANEELMKQMDEAAKQAQAEFEEHFENWSARDVVAWWSKWYMKTGHKRLGRIVIALGKQQRT